MDKRRTSTFPHVPKEAIEIWLKLAHTDQAAEVVDPEDISPLDANTPPRRVIELALEQIRAFIAIYSTGQVSNDGSVGHMCHSEQVLDVVEGFLDYLLGQNTDPLLERMTRELTSVRKYQLNPVTRLNAYIGVLRAYHERMPAQANLKVAQVALEAEQELVDEALISPHLCRVANGSLLGDPGARFERSLLQQALPWLDKIAHAGSGTDAGIGAETLLERARNATLQPIQAGMGMALINQIVTFCRNLSAPLVGAGVG